MAEWKDEQYKVREEGLRETINALDARLQKANESGMYYFNQCNIQKQQLIDKAMKVICNGCAQKAECEFNNWKTCSTKDELIKSIEE